MKVLGINTASQSLSLGIIQEEKTIIELTFSQSDVIDLILHIDESLKKSSLTLSDLGLISVVKGPGSYTGLRAGLTVVKTLSQTLGIPIKGVSALEALGYNFLNTKGLYLVALNAFRDDFNVGLFSINDFKLSRISLDLVLSVAEIEKKISKIKGELFLISDQPEKFSLKAGASLIKGTSVARLGKDLFLSQGADDSMTLVPDYLRDLNLSLWKS